MKIALGLTLVVAGIYFLTASGHLGGQDQEYYYRMARSLAREHTFAIEPLIFNNTELAGRRGRDGRFYAEYAPGLPVALSPLVTLGDAMRTFAPKFASRYLWLHEGDDDVLPRIFVSYFDILIVALTAGLLVLFATRLDYSLSAAAFVGAAFALSTFAWGQARIINPEPLQTFLVIGAVLLTLRASTTRCFLGGCALGFALLVKMTSVLVLPALLVLRDERDIPIWRRPARATAVLAPVICAFAIYAWYNHCRFGNFLTTGYNISGTVAALGGNGLGNPAIGLYGLLFSTGRGIVWYAPPVLAAMIASVRFYRSKRSTALVFLVLVALWVGFHSFYKGWDSGWGWGPRYLLPALPFLLIPIAEALKFRAGKVVSTGLCVIGFCVQLPGALADFMVSGHAGMALFGQTVQDHTAASFVAWRNFQLAGSEIVRDSALVLHGQFDLAWLTFANTCLPMITFAVAVLLFTSGAFMLISPRRTVHHGNTQ